MSDLMTVPHLSRLAVAHTTAIAGAVEGLRGHAEIIQSMVATIEGLDATQRQAIATLVEGNGRLADAIASLVDVVDGLRGRVEKIEMNNSVGGRTYE